MTPRPQRASDAFPESPWLQPQPGADRPLLLLVDDNPNSLRMAISILEPDHTFVLATCGADALACAAHNPDLILLDHMLPDIDGVEVCKRLKACPETAEIPVIFVTGVHEPELETRGLEAGAIDFVTKPYSAAVLRARVDNHIQLKQKTDLLKQAAQRDGLTGVANRRTFDEVLETEWRRARRDHAPLSLLMLDIDHFKAVNDRFGHLTGDECLRCLTRCLGGVLKRPSDLLARYGGEEFVVLLPGTDAAGAWQLAERMRVAVEQGTDTHYEGCAHAAGGLPPLTASIGCSTMIPGDGDEAADLIRRADSQLYEAKQAGRNRVQPSG